jgi:hypothetical protein
MTSAQAFLRITATNLAFMPFSADRSTTISNTAPKYQLICYSIPENTLTVFEWYSGTTDPQAPSI